MLFFLEGLFSGAMSVFGRVLVVFLLSCYSRYFFKTFHQSRHFFNHVIDIFISQWETGHGEKKLVSGGKSVSPFWGGQRVE